MTDQEFISKYQGAIILDLHSELAYQPSDSPYWKRIRQSAQDHLESIRQECLARMDDLDKELNVLADKWNNTQRDARAYRQQGKAYVATVLCKKHGEKHAIWWELSQLFDEMT